MECHATPMGQEMRCGSMAPSQKTEPNICAAREIFGAEPRPSGAVPKSMVRINLRSQLHLLGCHEGRQKRAQCDSAGGISYFERPFVDDLGSDHGRGAGLVEAVERGLRSVWAAGSGRVEKHIDIVGINEGMEGGGENLELEPETGKDQDRSVFGHERVDKGLVRPWRNMILDNEPAE
jgi:hypothetical protein